SRTTRWMLLNVSVGLKPSGPTSLVSLSICCLMPATRISKNSSRFELKIERNFTHSISGWVGSCASSRTRRLNSSQLNSRLMKFRGSEKRFAAGTSFRRSSIPAAGSSATLTLAAAVGIYLFVESMAEKRPRAIQATTAWKIRQEPDMLPRAASCRGRGSLMPDVFSGGSVNCLFGNIRGVIAHAFEATANKNQIQVAPQLLRVLRHTLN